jgi:Na+-driven multidrug efflux pump
MLRILAPGYLALSLGMVFWGVIRGAGDAMSPLWGALFQTVVLRVPFAYLFVHLFGTPEAIMYSMLISWFANMLISLFTHRRGKWRTMSLVK